MTKAIRSHGTLLQMGDGGTAGTALDIASTAVGDLYTIITMEAHSLKEGQPVTIAGVTGEGATAVNGTWPVRVLTTTIIAVKVATTGAGTGGTATPVAETFTTVAEVGDIKGPQLTRDTMDVTSHDSPDDYEEFIATIKKSGEVSFPVNWVPADPTHDGSTGLMAAYEDGNTRNWRLVLTDDEVDPSMLAFSGFVDDMSTAMPVNGKLEADVKIKVIGKPILTITGS
jgi:hypothetical protein